MYALKKSTQPRIVTLLLEFKYSILEIKLHHFAMRDILRVILREASNQIRRSRNQISPAKSLLHKAEQEDRKVRKYKSAGRI